jgi:hypothetical protein
VEAVSPVNPRELQNASLLAGNRDMRPMGNRRHQVAYRPDAELSKVIVPRGDEVVMPAFSLEVLGNTFIRNNRLEPC